AARVRIAAIAAAAEQRGRALAVRRDVVERCGRARGGRTVIGFARLLEQLLSPLRILLPLAVGPVEADHRRVVVTAARVASIALRLALVVVPGLALERRHLIG